MEGGVAIESCTWYKIMPVVQLDTDDRPAAAAAVFLVLWASCGILSVGRGGLSM